MSHDVLTSSHFESFSPSRYPTRKSWAVEALPPMIHAKRRSTLDSRKSKWQLCLAANWSLFVTGTTSMHFSSIEVGTWVSWVINSNLLDFRKNGSFMKFHEFSGCTAWVQRCPRSCHQQFCGIGPKDDQNDQHHHKHPRGPRFCSQNDITNYTFAIFRQHLAFHM